MPEKLINISICIANQPRIRLQIPRSDEEVVRRAEANINELWGKWQLKKEFSSKSTTEILAMVTFRFAQLYYSTLQATQNLDATLGGLEKSLDALLLDDLSPSTGESDR